MRCYQFLTNENYGAIISRLCAMTRGISDPLVQAYCIAYLCRKGREMAPDKSEFLVTALKDMMTAFKFLNTTQTTLRDNYMTKYKLSLIEWMDLFSPALDWLTQCLAPLQTMNNFLFILSKYEEHQEGLVLHHLIDKFKPQFLAAEAFQIMTLIKKAKVESYPRHLLVAELGSVCARETPPKDRLLVLLNDVWSEVRKLQESPLKYLTAAEAWLGFTLRYFSDEEVNVVMADVVGLVKKHESEIESDEVQVDFF
jgi:hypothetical protein